MAAVGSQSMAAPPCECQHALYRFFALGSVELTHFLFYPLWSRTTVDGGETETARRIEPIFRTDPPLPKSCHVLGAVP